MSLIHRPAPDANFLRRTLTNRPARALEAGIARPAAVLVALEPGQGVWLTRRAAHLSKHAGQVALPGGTIDASDGSPEAAAIREAHEEIGLDPAQIELLGRLDDFPTGTGFRITPITAILHGAPHFAPAPGEVDAIFRLDFSTLLSDHQPEWRRATWHGGTRDYPVWPHPDHVIWGATAWILLRLAKALRETPGP
ncbi:MAG: NUDIX hydrolase [Acidiphilium sp.]